ncbi:methyl-accepting chemotaxis protein [Marinomonas alcarazii]|uniref:Methyl-accepting chemotaxis protein n=1 Tax=Marinomonas alcarazii TaxID=491949 RepID=A0A318UZN8_9GAMM|nr:methyl-accepting chemotaxis protein [Marinomonas alcarazii]PYF81037.1 methyl-accepting chemotaxis protein [Marinomonas alcarazii]
MNSLSVKAKFITLIFSIIIIFLVALSLIKSKSTELADRFNRFYEENHNVSLNVERVKEAQIDIMLNVRGLQIAYLLSLDKQIPGYLEAISNSYNKTPSLINELNKGLTNKPSESKKLQTLVNDFQSKTKTFVTAMENSADNKAPFPVFSAFIGSYNELLAYFSTLTDKTNQEVKQAKQQTEDLIGDIEIGFWTSILIAIAISITLSYLISNNIVRGILAVRDAAQNMAQGYLNKPVQISGSDEIAELGNAINTSTKNLRSVISSVLSSVDKVNENSQEVLKVNQEVGEFSVQIMDNTTQVVVALDQMSANNRTIADNTQQSAEAAGDIRAVAQNSLSTANGTLDAINKLVFSLKNTGEVVTQLRQETNNIETILEVIRGIAEQTNLLALNAAIEAARAGEQGRGFAVVADEVRTLAQRSQDSVNEIETLLAQLSTASGQAVKSMESSLLLADSSKEQVEETNKLTSNILMGIERVSEQAQQIAQSIEEQTQVSEDITKKMHSVQSLTNQSAEMAKRSGIDMAQSSVDVQKQLGFFKL